MSISTWILVGFGIYAVILALIGYVCGKTRLGDDLVLGGRNLNRYLVAIAAMSAGNSGFIMTGAVGLGYAYGVHWLLLPLAWLAGDLVFWISQPSKLNALAQLSHARSIPALLAADTAKSKMTVALRRLIGIVVVGVALIYACSQFVAAGKVFSSFTGINFTVGVILTCVIVGYYCVAGGFRATVWTDVLQGILMVITTILVITVALAKQPNLTELKHSLQAVSPTFLSLTGTMSIGAIIGFVAGWACAAFGFGLSQPHLVLMYMAGKSPEETLKARWFYIFLLQFTWMGMTLFGVLARPLLEGISDPETTLAHFSTKFCGVFGSILIFNGAFSAIASTIDALVVSSTGTLVDDVLQTNDRRKIFRWLSFGFVVVSAASVSLLPQSVFGIASLAVSLLACTIGPLVMLRLCLHSLSPKVTLWLLLINLLIATLWRTFGLSASVNEACPAIFLGLIVLLILKRREAPMVSVNS